MACYVVMTGNGKMLCDGIFEHEIERIAQGWDNCLAETVYYTESGADDDEGIAVEPHTVRCECGEYTGERCIWIGSPENTVVVEYMPMYLRASHKAAGGAGVYPHDGS